MYTIIHITKNLVLIIILFITIQSFGQSEITEEIKNDKGESVSVKNVNSNPLFDSPEAVVEEFYQNISDIEKLDPLFSFRFFQETPYTDFKKSMNEKNRFCGKLIKKSLNKSEYSSDGQSWQCELTVEYENLNSLEQFILIKETRNDDFKIFGYNIQKL